ncbi:hypothetical protein Misp01_67040 [Microtetraspora sp. NBRC 13810]|uniref:hypothetical protein n=1 Tax=Microtetraspora sp. NBRC 13810 TaxID=3030990 RepID=UPI0024A12345|nr:hypothetical protein [Microtetraspora sp. NBRC 13810]GLW11576.1 hypothetical protein Misp01_67040 [Microtetraspora sp. NBRC 13810]
MAVSANLDKLLDKAYEESSLQALLDAPVAGLAGVSKADAEALEKAFDVKTIGDLGRLAAVRAAVTIVDLADLAK